MADVAQFDTRTTDGFRIIWNGGSAPAANYRLLAWVLFDTDGDASIDVGEGTSSATLNGTSTITLDSSFDEEPEIVFVLSHVGSFNDTLTAGLNICIGCGHSTGGGSPTISQWSSGFNVDDNAASAQGRRYHNNRILAQSFETVGRATLELTDTGTESFEVTTRDLAGSDTFAYLAISTRGLLDYKVDVWDMPNTTGNQSYTSAGFQPQFYALITGLLNFSVLNSNQTGNLAGTQIQGSVDDTNGGEYSLGVFNQNSTGGAHGSYGDAGILQVRNHQGTYTWRGTHSSFNSNGFTINVTGGVANNNGVCLFLASTAPKSVQPTPSHEALVDVGIPTVTTTVSVTASSHETLVEVGTPSLSLVIKPESHEELIDRGAPTVSQGGVTLSATGHEMLVEAGTPSLSLVIRPDAHETLVETGTPSIAATATVAPDGHETLAEIGTPALSLVIKPEGHEALVDVGSPTVAVGTVTVSPAGHETLTETGVPSLSLIIRPDGHETIVEVGTPTVAPGAVSVQPGGHEVLVEFGTAEVASAGVLAPESHETLVEAGSPTLRLFVQPSGAEALVETGTPSLSLVVAPSGHESLTEIGEPTVTLGASTLLPAEHETLVETGQPAIVLSVAPEGHEGLVEVGSPSVVHILAPSAHETLAEFGSPTVTTGATTLQPSGHEELLQFGATLIQGALVAVGHDLLIEIGSPTVAAFILSPAAHELLVEFGLASVNPGASGSTYHQLARVARSRLSSVAAGLGLTVEHDNAPFLEPDAGCWIRGAVTFTGTSQLETGASNRYKRAGTLMVTVYCPIETGAEIHGTVNAVREAFQDVSVGAARFRRPSVVFEGRRLVSIGRGNDRSGFRQSERQTDRWAVEIECPFDTVFVADRAAPVNHTEITSNSWDEFRRSVRRRVEAQRADILAGVGLAEIPTYYDNAPSDNDEQPNGPWLQVSIAQGTTIKTEIRQPGRGRTPGFVAFSVYSRLLTGDGTALRIIDAIDARFRSIYDRGVVMRASNVRNLGRTNGDRWQTTMVLPFYVEEALV